jgi:hypothetical protein
MFNMFKVMKRKPKTTAEQKLEEISQLLFPPFGKETLSNGDKVLIDYSIDSNLESVISDLEDGHNDEVSQKTIRLSIQRLIEARKILEAFGEIDTDAKYIIVDDLSRKEDPLDEKVQTSQREH